MIQTCLPSEATRGLCVACSPRSSQARAGGASCAKRKLMGLPLSKRLQRQKLSEATLSVCESESKVVKTFANGKETCCRPWKLLEATTVCAGCFVPFHWNSDAESLAGAVCRLFPCMNLPCILHRRSRSQNLMMPTIQSFGIHNLV